MNEFDERYDIRLARRDEIEDIMQFLKKCWPREHILTKDRALFEYEYCTREGVNMIIARDRNSCKIEALFGFIYCSNTDDHMKKDIWGSMWIVNEKNDNMPLLGIELARRIYSITNCRMHIGNGANPKTTIPLRKLFFKDKTGKMKQYYMLNDGMEEYKLAVIKHKQSIKISIEKEIFERDIKVTELKSIEEVNAVMDIDDNNNIPYKDCWYINRRFFEHPYYKYSVLGIVEKNKTKGLVVTREVDALGSKALRIVDFYGDQEVFGKTGYYWQQLLGENKYEYVDFYEFGFDDLAIEKAGFVRRAEDDNNIIPNYYEPFEQKNVENYIHYRENGTLFFKADGDQDRPNMIR